MTCEAKQFINSNTIITITPGDNWTVSDVSEFTVTITNVSGDIAPFDKTFSGGDIVVDGSNLQLTINNTDITVEGWYHFKMVLFTTASQRITLNPCPNETIYFHSP